MNKRIKFIELKRMQQMIEDKDLHDRDLQFIYNSNKSLSELLSEYTIDTQKYGNTNGLIMFRKNILENILEV